jgi:hypothetical protein
MNDHWQSESGRYGKPSCKRFVFLTRHGCAHKRRAVPSAALTRVIGKRLRLDPLVTYNVKLRRLIPVTEASSIRSLPIGSSYGPGDSLGLGCCQSPDGCAVVSGVCDAVFTDVRLV